MQAAPNDIERPAAAPDRGWRLLPTLPDRLMLGLVAVNAIVLVGATAAAAVQGFQLARAAAESGSVASQPALWRGTGAIVLFALAALVPGCFAIIGLMFTPIRRLSQAAQNVARGRFDTVDVKGRDSVGRLAATFNEMVGRLSAERESAVAAQRRLKQVNANLERTVEDRTAAIERASQRLQSEIAEKEDFLRAVSHDLNAPLRNIDGMVAMIQKKHGDSLDADVLRRLERVQANVKAETELISEILELSRIKSRRDEPEPVRVGDLIWELRGLFENDLREQNIDLVVETQMPTLMVEKARLRQIFQNLIDNAIKYMGDSVNRRIVVSVMLGREEATFNVRDTGIGIAPEDCEKVFYVFRRGNNHGGVEGKGVGLASVKAIVENYQGTIWVEPNLRDGGGSSFSFTVNSRFVQDNSRVFAKAADDDNSIPLAA